MPKIAIIKEGLLILKQNIKLESDNNYSNGKTLQNYFIKKSYQSRNSISYFQDLTSEETGINYQPEVYPLAAKLAKYVYAKYIIDIGCGSGEKLAELADEFEIIGIDFGENIEKCKSKYSFGTWIEFDLESNFEFPIPREIISESIIINSDVIEHLKDPSILLHNLKSILEYSRLAILSTPERELNWGKEHSGPPPNPTHIREWSIAEFKELLNYYHFTSAFCGLTISNTRDLKEKSILTVLQNPDLLKNFPNLKFEIRDLIENIRYELVLSFAEDKSKHSTINQISDEELNKLIKNIKSKTSEFYKKYLNVFENFEKAQQTFTKNKIKQAKQFIEKYKSQINYSDFPVIDFRPKRKISVSIIIVAYSTKQLLIDLLQLLNKQTEQDFEIIIVDNGGNDSVLSEILNFNLCYVRCPINLVLSEGRNIGVSFSKSEIVVFLDDDALIPNNYIGEIKRVFKKYNIAGLRGKVLPKTSSLNNKFANHYDLGENAFPASVDTEGNSAFRKKDFLNAGGMDPLLFGGEGTDLSYRIAKLEKENSIIYYPKVIIYHDYADTTIKLKTKEDRHKLMKKYMLEKFPDIYDYHHRQKLYTSNKLTQVVGESKIKRYSVEGDVFFTLGVINYNGAKFIAESLQSALNQSYNNYEIIIVDDGSTDNSVEIINSFLENQKVKLITSEHLGAPNSRNTVVKNSKGDFIVWLDSDDVILQGTLEKYYKYIKQNPVCDVIYGNLIVTNENLQPENNMIFLNWFGKNYYMPGQMLMQNLIPNVSTAIRRSLFDKFGNYDQEFRRAHDYQFWARIVEHANFAQINSFVALYRWHNTNLSARNGKPDRAYEVRILLSLLNRFPLNMHFTELFEKSNDKKKSESIAYYLIAKKLFEYNDFNECSKFCKKSINAMPYKENLELLDEASSHLSKNVGEISNSKDEPFLTIGIITYNRAQYLKSAIDSALNQKGNFEIVIVDDGSTDNTNEILKNYKSDKIRTFIKGHTNAPDSRNRVIKEAKGNYILWLDSDDEMLPGIIEEYAKLSQSNPDADVFYCNNIRIIDGTELKEKVTYKSFNGKINPSEFLQGPPIPNVGTLIKKTLFEKVGMYNTDFIRAHDFEFWIRTLEVAKFYHCDKYLMHHRLHKSGNLSPINYENTDTSFEIRILDNLLQNFSTQQLFSAIDWAKLSSENHKQIDAKIFYVLARAYFKWNGITQAESYTLKSLENYDDLEVKEFLIELRKNTNDLNNVKNNLDTLNVTAIISAYNEGDVIYHVIKDLIDQDISVYLIDHHSKDNTVAEASKLLGKGLIKIEQFPDESGFEIPNDVYAWRYILQRKEQIAKELGPGWYINADADEFRESPWQELNLKEGILKVNKEGYNAINFSIYDFKPTNNNFKDTEDVREYLTYYSSPKLNVDNVQVKCWKNFGQEFNLWNSGGHIVEFENRKIYPLPFILRHYPIRNQKHGERKVFEERKKRFDSEERKVSWHAQYDHIQNVKHKFIHKENELIMFNRETVCNQILNRHYGNVQHEQLKVSIIIPTYNQLQFTKECIESLYAYTKIPFELIIIINNKNDGTVELLNEFSKSNSNIKMILNNGNMGFPVSINQGIKESIGEYVLILNNDVVVTEYWLETLLDIAKNNKSIGIVGPISNEVSGVQKDKEADYKSIEEMHLYAAKIREKNKNKVMHFSRVAFLCTLIKRELLEKIGGLDERFTPGNFEDDDFCLRAQLAGYKTVIAQDVFIHHYGSKSFKANGEKKYIERLKTNHEIFINKWGADPDEIWIKQKSFNQKRTLFISINKDEFVKHFERATKMIEDKEFNFALSNLDSANENYETSEKASSMISKEDLLILIANISLIVKDLRKSKNHISKRH